MFGIFAFEMLGTAAITMPTSLLYEQALQQGAAGQATEATY